MRINSFLSFFLVMSFCAQAQITISSVTTPHTQNFNSLRSSSGSSNTLPSGWRLTETGSAANTRYTVDAGTNTAGDTYSYGAVNNTERALGSLQSSSVNSVFGAQFRNTTGRTITSLIINYTGEQWRCGTTGRGADRLDFQYSLNASSLTAGTWTDANQLDFNSPFVATVGARNGNLAENRSLLSATITGLNIANNAIFWIRWSDLDVPGADDGLAIDDFSIQLSSADLTPPTISSLNPANNATGISINPILSVTFSETIQKGTGNLLIRNFADGSILQTIDVNSTLVTVAGSVATINTTIGYGLKVYVEASAGTFRDQAGNAFAGISSNNSWSFTTIPPPQPALDTLKIVSWNIEWFGGSLGPTDDNLQQQNVLTVLKNLQADIYALQEVVSAARLQSVVAQMPGYSLIIGDDFCSNGSLVSSCASAQKMAYIFKSDKVAFKRSYAILRSSANAYYNWSSGRFPYLMDADVTMNGTTRRIVFVNVHAKANTSDFVVSYNRRKAGADELRDSLNLQYGNENVIILGDLNDDLDKTITTQVAPDTTTSWIAFKADPVNYSLPSLPLSLARVPSTASYPDIIDHAILSNEMNAFFVSGSANILKNQVEGWIPSYSTTTSDHYPLETKYIWSGAVTMRKKNTANHVSSTKNLSKIKWLSSPTGGIRLIIQNEYQEQATIRLIDVNGKELMKKEMLLSKGENQTEINPGNLVSRGIGFIQLFRNGKMETVKVVF